MKHFAFSAFLLLFVHFQLFSQPGTGGGYGNGAGKGAMQPGAKLPAIGVIYGKIVDSKTKQAIDYATVTLLALQKDSVINGALTKSNGDFSIEKIPFGRYRLRVQFLGYKTIFKPVSVTPKSIEQDLGNITVDPEEKSLSEVVVEGDRPTVTMGIDRRIYNVEKDISTRGGTGLDVMKNIPGLTVDADGNVSLRNNSPTVFIDGRPSTLTLEQIPADQIERVEVITNPSAKYDAGSTGGIINVIMKKNTKPGYNGMIGANVGTNTRYGANGNLNVKEGRVNFFLSYNLNHRENPVKGYTRRTNLRDGEVISKYNQNSNTNLVNQMQNARFGFDYTVNNRNTLTVSQNMTFGSFKTLDYQTFSQVDGNDSLLYSGDRTNDQKTSFQNFTSQAMWKHTTPKQGKEWTTDLTLNIGKNSSTSNFTTYNYDYAGVLFPDNPQLQTNLGAGNNKMLTYQFDFTNPLTDTAKLEFGVKSNYQNNQSSLDVTEYNYSTSENIKDTFLSNRYKINSWINAAYINYTNMLWGIGYQAGLRFEQTYFTAELPDKNLKYEYIYPNGTKDLMKALFPSIYLSKKFNPKNEVQLNFSRKINRPGWMQVIPFIMFSDKQNYQIGNPALAPEFINLAEANYNYIFGFGNWLSSFYTRYQQNPITNYVYPSPTDSNVLISTFINGNSNLSYGFENTVKFSFFKKKLDISLNANVYHSHINATANSSNLQNSGFSWYTKDMISYKLPANFTLQINGNYEAPRIIPQGKTKPVYYMDVSLNKDIGKKISLTLKLNDAFNTQRFGSLYDTDLFTQDLSRRRETRYLRLSFTYRFGEWDVSLFKRKAQKRNTDQNTDQMEY